MQPFTRLEAVAAPIDLPNVDTDRVIPARFLRKPQGSPGYERYLFHDVRFDAGGAERPEFVLNQPGFREARTVTAPDGAVHRFDIDPFRKRMLLDGQDDIGLTLAYEPQIAAYEAQHRAAPPWLTG